MDGIFLPGERAPPKMPFFDTSKCLKCQKNPIFSPFLTSPHRGARGENPPTKEQGAISNEQRKNIPTDGLTLSPKRGKVSLIARNLVCKRHKVSYTAQIWG